MYKNKILKEAGKISMHSADEMSSSRTPQTFLTKTKSSDPSLLHLDIKETVEQLVNIVMTNKNSSIRFTNYIGENEDNPSLSINPNDEHTNMKGIYYYQLNKKSLGSLFLETQRKSREDPWGGTFVWGNDFKFMQLLEIKSNNTLSLDINDKGEIKSNFNKTWNIKTLKSDVKEIIRLSLILMEQSSSLKSNSKNFTENKHFKLFIKKFFTPSTLSGIDKEDKLYIDNFINYTKNFKNKGKIVNDLTDISIRLSNTPINSHYTQKDLFLKLYFCCYYWSKILKLFLNPEKSNRFKTSDRYFSVLLNSIGITSINDNGTGVIHYLEPYQGVIFDFSGDEYELIGTYKNIFLSNKDDLQNIFIETLQNKNLDISLFTNDDFLKHRSSKPQTYYEKKYKTYDLEDFKIDISNTFTSMDMYSIWANSSSDKTSPFVYILKYSSKAKKIFNYAYSLGEAKLGEIFYGILEILQIDVDDFLELEKEAQDSEFYRNLNAALNESLIKKYITLILS